MVDKRIVHNDLLLSDKKYRTNLTFNSSQPNHVRCAVGIMAAAVNDIGNAERNKLNETSHRASTSKEQKKKERYT